MLKPVYQAMFSGSTNAKAEIKAYAAICDKRCDQYKKHIEKMEIPEDLWQWASRMEINNGKICKIWAHDVDYITGLLITRWGEAVDHWPMSFAKEDKDRAYDWLYGNRLPAGVIQRKKLEIKELT